MSALPGNHEGLVTFTSEGTTGDDNAAFFNVLGNSIRVKNVVKMAARLTLIPNVFSNVSASLKNNVFIILGSNGPRTFVIPDGQYSLVKVLTTMNLQGNVYADAQFVWQTTTAVDGTLRVTVTIQGFQAFQTLTWPADSRFPDLIGSGDPTQQFTFNGQPFTFQHYPVIITLPLVHVLCPEIAGNSHIDEKGRTHSVLESVDFTDVPFGAYAKVRNDTAELCSVDFDFPQDLSKVNFYIVGPRFEPLVLSKGAHVYIQCRIWSADK